MDIRLFFSVFFSGAVSAVVSIYLHIHSRKTNSARERLDKIIAPIFYLLEPYLFKDLPFEALSPILTQISDLVYENRTLSGGVLYDCIKNVAPNKFDSSHFMSLCSYIDSQYDFLCKSCGIPLRPFQYRLNNRQFNETFTSKFLVIFRLFIYPALCFLIVIFILFTCSLLLCTVLLHLSEQLP